MTNHVSQSTMHDFDLHGSVGIRLLNATDQDVRAVARQLGPIQKPLTRAPDITIRFVERLALSGPLRYLGLNDTAFTDDAFLILRSKHKTQARVQIPLAQVGQPCEILCEHGAPAVPLLIAIINLTALHKGVLPLHASAFCYNGKGVLTTGWSKGGKTETLLAFTAQGATYIGDEWVYLGDGGRQMHGIPEPLRIWDWHLAELPQYWAHVGPQDRTRLRLLRNLAYVAERTADVGSKSIALPAKVMRRLGGLLKEQLYVDMAPQKIFGEGHEATAAPLDYLFFVASHATQDICVEPIAPSTVAERMVFSLQYEQLPLLEIYYKFRFAFPELRNELLEESEACQRELLRKMLAGKPAHALYHPYPVKIPDLFDALVGLIG
ncbi:MAG: hypothetical protein R3C14_54865 [Caldilineaceae bacterium]